MKKLLVLLLLLPVMAGANDKTIVYVDTIVEADTVATNVNVDTVYSVEEDIRGFNGYQFFYQILEEGTKFTSSHDTFYVYWQHSFDRSSWHDMLLGKSVDVASVWSTLYPTATDSIIGNWGRFMVIHRDSTSADEPDSIGNVRGNKFKLWLSEKP